MVYSTNKKRWYISEGEILTAGCMEAGSILETNNVLRFFDNETMWKFEIKHLNISEDNVFVKREFPIQESPIQQQFKQPLVKSPGSSVRR